MSTSSEPPLYHLDAARGEGQRARMQALEEAGECLFCADDRPEVERRGEHWYVVRNDFPYAGTAAHYLIVARRHVTSFLELPDEAGAELWAHKRWLHERLCAPAATATVERSGDMALNGGSVAHLHTHVVAPAPDPERAVRFRVSARGRHDA